MVTKGVWHCRGQIIHGQKEVKRDWILFWIILPLQKSERTTYLGFESPFLKNYLVKDEKFRMMPFAGFSAKTSKKDDYDHVRSYIPIFFADIRLFWRSAVLFFFCFC